MIQDLQSTQDSGSGTITPMDKTEKNP